MAAQRAASEPRAIAALRLTARSTKATFWRSRRLSANTAPRNGADGPLFLAKDTHALSEPAFVSALEVLAANGVQVMVDDALGYTPTPALSHAVLTYNHGRTDGPGRWHRDHAVPQSAGRWWI